MRKLYRRGVVLFSASSLWMTPPSFGAYTLSTVATFDGTTNGAFSTSDLTLSGSILYGTTQGNGTDNVGTVFSVPVAGGPLSLH